MFNKLSGSLVASFLLLASTGSAAVMGSFNTDGNGSQTTLTLASISFNPTINNLRVTSSTLTYGATNTLLAVNTIGTILGASALPVDFFMTFNGTTLDFKLLSFGTGDLTDPHDCSQAITNGKSCSLLLPGGFISPVILTYDQGGTDAVLFVSGTVTDGTGAVSSWSGHLGTTLTASLDTYTSPKSGVIAPTPLNIAQYFGANPTGSLTSSHSDTFTATVVPEPGTWALMLGGLLMGAGMLRRKSAKV